MGIFSFNHFHPGFRQCWHSIPDSRRSHYGAGNTGAPVDYGGGISLILVIPPPPPHQAKVY